MRHACCRLDSEETLVCCVLNEVELFTAMLSTAAMPITVTESTIDGETDVPRFSARELAFRRVCHLNHRVLLVVAVGIFNK